VALERKAMVAQMAQMALAAVEQLILAAAVEVLGTLLLFLVVLA